jgi:hypothetical protein
LGSLCNHTLNTVPQAWCGTLKPDFIQTSRFVRTVVAQIKLLLYIHHCTSYYSNGNTYSSRSATSAVPVKV